MIIKKIVNKISNIIRIKKLNKKGSKISYKSNIDKYCDIEEKVSIYENVSLYATKVGKMTYISPKCIFTKTVIGKYCSIAPNVKIIVGSHPTRNFVSTHPIFYSRKVFCGITYCNEQKFQEYKYANEEEKKFCIIGNDVWIGQDVKILDGVKIGDGAIIAAGAVVTKNVEPYAIVGGVPAKIIRYRFEKEDIEYLLNLKWWNKPDSWIKDNSNFFENIHLLKLEDTKNDKENK